MLNRSDNFLLNFSLKRRVVSKLRASCSFSQALFDNGGYVGPEVVKRIDELVDLGFEPLDSIPQFFDVQRFRS
jgi:hypothetical protein